MNIRLSTISLAVFLVLHQGALWANPITLDPNELTEPAAKKSAAKKPARDTSAIQASE